MTIASRWVMTVRCASILATLGACGDDGSTTDDDGPDAVEDGSSDPEPVTADPPTVVGFWSASANCGGAFEIAYGFAVCGSGKVLGVEQVRYQGNQFEWLDSGSHVTNGDTVTFDLSRTVVEPSEIAGDVNRAVLTLSFDEENDQLTVLGAEEMPECAGLPLMRTDSVVDADCELEGGGSGDDGGCTADSDCGTCERCERSTGNCLTKLSC